MAYSEKAGNVAIGSSVGGGLGGIVGGIASLLGAGGGGGDRLRKQVVAAWENLKAADFDVTAIPPADFRILAEMRPDLVEMVMPLQPKDVQESYAMRGSQVASLGRLEAMRDQGMPLAERAAVQGAMRQVGGASRAANEAVLRDLAERGRLGAGDEAAARLIANQQAGELANQQGTALGQMMSQNRLLGAQGAANLAGTIRGQDVSLAAENAAQRNRYNELVANILNQGVLTNQAARQGAQQYNVGLRNELLGQAKPLNVQQTAAANQATRNQLMQQGYQNELERLKGYSATALSQAEAKDEERRKKEQAYYSIGSGVGGLGGAGIGGLL